MLRNLLSIVVRQKGDGTTVALLFVTMVIAAVFEALGVGLIVPFVALVQRPELARSQPLAARVLAALHVHTSGGAIVVAGVGLVAFFVVKSGYLLLAQRWQARFVYGRFVRLSEELLETYLRAPYTLHLQRNSAELVRNVVTDAAAVFNNSVVSALVAVVEVLTATVIAGVLVALEPVAIPVVAAVVGVLAYAFQSFLRGRITTNASVYRVEQEKMLRLAHEALGGIKEARVMGREPEFLRRYTLSVAKYADSLQTYRILTVLPRLGLETLGVLGLVMVTTVLLGRGARAVDIVPLLAALALGLVRLMPSATRILAAFGELRLFDPAVRALLVDLKIVPTDRRERERQQQALAQPLPFETAVRFVGVGYRYPNAERDALHDVDLEIRVGETIAIVGASGAGKTTLVDVLIGLLRPTAGHIEVDGQPLEGERVYAWQRQVGYIPQHVYLCDDTLRRNIAFGLPDEQIDDARLARAVRVASLDDLTTSLPNGLDTVVGERGARLSGGQRQRVGIARAVYLDPKFLVLDEATAALDGATERSVVEAIQALKRDRTTVVIAHRLSTVRDCDRVVLLRDGAVSRAGSWQEMLGASEEFRLLAELGGVAS